MRLCLRNRIISHRYSISYTAIFLERLFTFRFVYTQADRFMPAKHNIHPKGIAQYKLCESNEQRRI